ncbi:Stp1/IreP family PP2C-type Ser/Thr phosphatase [Altericista sp. CCNU0014]|uniref:Stp1/IreP family PP2C-type Ser/Thr phosphatase n=1 Tax=Altericista sp. CCNU0014 TaxID=3082949 RepID=UPI00384FDB64
MKLRFAGLSDRGAVRTANQDAYCIDDPQGRFFIVADGMGGHAGGEEASRIATFAIQDFLEKNWGSELDPADLLREAFVRANQHILQTQKVSPERADMGTTAVAVVFAEDGSPWCAHVGDSRLYRFRDGELKQVTEDHTWVAQAVQAKILTPAQVRLHPWRHVLSQCLGRDELNRIDIQPIDLQSGDLLLLCSDGLTEEVEDEAIAQLLENNPTCDRAADALVQEAKANGGQDNITVVLLAVDEIMDSSRDDPTVADLNL